MINLIARIICVVASLGALSLAQVARPSSHLSPSERQIIKLACNHSVVMLGENGHGDGSTISIKARIIPELVAHCGFSAIAFESSYYDFAELARSTPAHHRYDRQKFLSAIGRIWNQDAEFQPLADWVARQTSNKLAMFGIDDTFGSAGATYSLSVMPGQLAMLVPENERPVCQALLALDGWPGLDDAAQQSMTDHCLANALESLVTSSNPDVSHLRAMANAYRRSNARRRLQTNEFISARDLAMADNLDAFRRALSPGTKIIVWVANAHAALGGYKVGSPIGQIAKTRYGLDLFTVGFSSAGGKFRWSRNEVRKVPLASEDSLETRILQGRSAAVATQAQLASMGTIPGSALSWHQRIETNWSGLFDAIYVLGEERPTTIVIGN